MSWYITISSEECPYHFDNDNCDLLSGGRCEKEECPMIDRFLKKYLLAHEFDIAIGENDFGRLQGTFESIIGKAPKE